MRIGTDMTVRTSHRKRKCGHVSACAPTTHNYARSLRKMDSEWMGAEHTDGLNMETKAQSIVLWLLAISFSVMLVLGQEYAVSTEGGVNVDVGTSSSLVAAPPVK